MKRYIFFRKAKVFGWQTQESCQLLIKFKDLKNTSISKDRENFKFLPILDNTWQLFKEKRRIWAYYQAEPEMSVTKVNVLKVFQRHVLGFSKVFWIMEMENLYTIFLKVCSFNEPKRHIIQNGNFKPLQMKYCCFCTETRFFIVARKDLISSGNVLYVNKKLHFYWP